MTKVLAGIATIALMVVLVSFMQEKPAWDVPAKYKEMKNPSAGNADAIALGKTTYAKFCKSCHGNLGKGDGPRAKMIKTPIDDFTSAEFKKHPAGVVYYMSIVGRGDMPNFEKKITDEETRWAVVSYIESLK